METVFSYYSGNIKFTKCLGQVTVSQFIDAHKSPKESISVIINKIKQEQDKAKRRKLKQMLYSFTPSVVIAPGAKRVYDNIVRYTGLMQLDFDGIDDLDMAMDLKQHVFNNYDSILCSYLSPSGNVKCLLKTIIPRDKTHYKAIFKAVKEEFDSYGYFDEAPNNAMLPLFLSIDENILSRDYNDCNVWSKEDWSKPDYKHLNKYEKGSVEISNSKEAKVSDIIFNRVNSISSNGHPQLRTAALILGSRVGAGYIDLNSAEILIKNLIISNSYLVKDVDGYLKTADWAIKQGMNNPKYF